MNINFTARQTQVTPDIEKYCEKRLKAIEKKLGYEVEANIILSVEKYRNIAEIRVKTRKAALNTIEETGNMLSSLDAAFDHLVRRINKEKAKFRERKRQKARMPHIYETSGEEETEKKVIRSHNYTFKPMTVEGAILQLESGKREVIVFRMFDSEKWAVIYRRADGHYGLIEMD
jgi:putative sigma-54 modulation protein